MNSRQYFPNFDAMRGIGALIVFLIHLSSIQSLGGFKVFYHIPVPDDLVLVMFFTISGFLITFLLFVEKEKYKDINLKKYFIRRILRIWPLYYLLIIASIFILPSISFLHLESTRDFNFRLLTTYDYICFFLILPNITLNYVPFTTQAWSIGIEEQFYFIQPFINKYLKNKKVIIGVLIFIILSATIFFLPLLIGEKYKELSPNKFLIVAKIYKSFGYFGCIAMGCLMAVFYYFKDEKVLKLLYSKALQILTYTMLLMMLIIQKKYKIEFDARFYGLAFAIITLNMGTNPKNLINIDNKILNYIGKISYSFYMLHILTLTICLNFLVRFAGFDFSSTIQNIFFYIFSLGFTILVSHLLFHYFEKPILGLKDKFTV
jgi:peptidoglycan/LPS O-acetylase OafA/YrhL